MFYSPIILQQEPPSGLQVLYAMGLQMHIDKEHLRT